MSIASPPFPKRLTIELFALDLDPVVRVGLIDRAIGRHLRCRVPRSFVSDNWAVQTTGLASSGSDGVADAKCYPRFGTPLRWLLSGRERFCCGGDHPPGRGSLTKKKNSYCFRK